MQIFIVQGDAINWVKKVPNIPLDNVKACCGCDGIFIDELITNLLLSFKNRWAFVEVTDKNMVALPLTEMARIRRLMWTTADYVADDVKPVCVVIVFLWCDICWNEFFRDDREVNALRLF